MHSKQAVAPLEWDGVRNGEEDANLGSNIDSRVSTLGEIFYKDLLVPVQAEGLVMTYAEVQFILAEAAQKGWIGGDPESYYNEGIKASVEYYNRVSGTNIAATEDFMSQPQVKFDPANALEQIGTQKWVALFFHDMQAWHEWKRTGLPNLSPSIVNNNNDKIPVRFQYPSSQQETNLENYTKAVSAQGEDFINTRVWWMQE